METTMSSQTSNAPQGTLLAQAIRRNLGSEGPSTQIGTTDKTILEQVLAIYRPEHTSTDDSSKDTLTCPTDNEDVNFNLVQSVVHHGLYNEDPFLTMESRLSISKDCLAIIRLVTQTTPRILIRPLTTDSDGWDSNFCSIPSWVWLLQRMLPLLCQTRMVSLRREMVDTLSVVLSELGRHTMDGDHSSHARMYLKSCVDGIVEMCRSDIKSTLKRSFSITLPNTKFILPRSKINSRPGVANIPGWCFTINDPVEACSLAIQITLAVSKVGLSHHATQVSKPCLDLSIALLAGLIQICQRLKAWVAAPIRSRLLVQIHKQTLEALAEILSYDNLEPDQPVFKLIQKLSTRSIQALLFHPVLEIDQETEISLSALLLLLLRFAERSNPFRISLSHDLVPCIKNILQDSIKWQARHRDLKVTLLKFALVCSEDYAFHQMLKSNLQLVAGAEWQFQSPVLQLLYFQLLSAQTSHAHVPKIELGNLDGPRKRRKIDMDITNHSSQLRRESISRMYSKFGGQSNKDLAGLYAIVADGFGKLSIQEQSDVFHEVGLLICLPTNSEGFLHSSNVRVSGMQAMRKIVKHGPAVLDGRFTSHPFGQWCLQALRSSNRDLRMLAVMTLPHFTIFGDHDENSVSERTACLLKVREISSVSDDTIQETCIIAWGRMSRILEGDDLHLALGLLLGYLGHSNTYLAAVSYNEIESVAQAKNISMSTLLGQFWRDLSVVVAEKAIKKIATVCYRKPVGVKREKNPDMLHAFFEIHVLGIIAQYSEVLFSLRAKHSLSEKRRNLKAIEDMIKLGKGGLINGLPQLSACLSSALEMKGLQDTTLSVWCALMTEIPSADIAPYFPVVLCLLIKFWAEFGEHSKRLGRSLLSRIFEVHNPTLQDEADSLPLMSVIPDFDRYEKALSTSRNKDLKEQLRILTARSTHENPLVVERALIELKGYLGTNEHFIRDITNDEIPDSVAAEVIRNLLDVCVKHGQSANSIAKLASECLGMIGAVDPNRFETPRKQDDLMILHNFEKTEESIRFAHFLLEHHLVKAFLSATDTRAQGFLSFAMQELLKFCGFSPEVLVKQNTDFTVAPSQTRWRDFSVTGRNVLSPYLSSKYILSTAATSHKSTYPIFSTTKSYREWLTDFLLDLLPKARGLHTKTLFAEIISKIVKGQDLSILNFILPYIVLHIVISGTAEDKNNILLEMVSILQHEMPADRNLEFEVVKRCSESVFILVDHMSKWIREKRRYNSSAAIYMARQMSRQVTESIDQGPDVSIASVEDLLSKLPPKLIGERSIQCQSYSRALFYWEQYMRKCRSEQTNMETLYTQMQSIYSEIDEPDGIEGISTKLSVVNIEQQILEHRKAGRWLAAYRALETLLVHLEPILSLHNSLLYRVLGFGIESAWRSLNWDKLEVLLRQCPEQTSFDVTIGRTINAFRSGDRKSLERIIHAGRDQLVRSMTISGTNSIRSSHEILFQFQVLAECQYITSTIQEGSIDEATFKHNMDARLTLLGPSHREKQYILALRRALLSLCRGFDNFTRPYISSLWLTTAKLARKKKDYHQAFTAILNSNDDQNGPIEQAKLAWDEGRHRRAIKLLENAIETNAFEAVLPTTDSFQELDASETRKRHPQSSAKARAMLLWARWMDSAGQIQSKVLVNKFRAVANSYARWEKGHFYLGRHYNNILKTERALPLTKRPESLLIGENVKLVCTNYMRAMTYGTRYIFQTLPQFLNLWLDFGLESESPFEPEVGVEVFRDHLAARRKSEIADLLVQIKRGCLHNIPTFVFLSALPQIMSRVGIQSESTWVVLEKIILRILVAYPQHTMWSILAVFKSGQSDRKNRATKILSRLKTEKAANVDLKTFIVAAQKLVQELLALSNFEIKGKPSHVSLRDDLNFQHNVAPVALIIPVQSALSLSFPADGLTPKFGHNPFSRDQATISKFEDEADVMSSLQKPRKITIIGSDGRRYPLMCKPKDDLRKDARLMEFNTIINRLLKKDDESSRRQLQIRTYAVTPLNEECGLIEWVNNLRPLRDILLRSYRAKNISVNYAEIRVLLDDACSSPSKYHRFEDVVVARFPAVFHEWFVELFPEPESWFAARLSYVRTTAVMSMVGYILGLGDRHGENILYDEVTGETQHVDFNCLFDKGLTFEKPERVPFRLTQNMVDAMGLTGYEGPFRRSSEVVMRILRQNEESLMTVVETFLHDPLVEWLARRTTNPSKAPDNPKDVLESIENKLRGLHAGDPVPLSVEGQVQELIQQAVNTDNLVQMYIGWCAYF
ncbi:serine/threonine-protein kinase M1 [Orbilia oligospora]|nr:serine/threonine-protein kinase M1 [Orbilia oligospora]